MKENEEKSIEDLMISEKKYRESGDYINCLDVCIQILNEIKSESNNFQFDIISKLFLYPNQSNYVRIYLIHTLIQDLIFIGPKNSKKKYYKLLIDSFKIEKSEDLLKQKNDIIKLYEKSDLENFDDIDKYIVTFVSSSGEIPLIEEQKKDKNLIIEEKGIIRRHKSLTFLPTPLLSSSSKRLESQENQFPQSSIQTSFEEININKQNDINFSIQKIMTTAENKKNEIRQLLKRYKINARLPLIIMSVSANLNKNQFLELIKNTLLKLNYKSVCNIRDSEYENLSIYEYNPKNCCENCKYLLKNKYIKNVFQVLTILKTDENNFNNGVHSFLNDINERKISIKSIKGNEQSINQFIISFLSKICLSMNKIKIIKQSKSLLKYNLEELIQQIIQNRKNQILQRKNIPKDILNSKNSNYEKLIEDETYVEKTNSQAKKYYELYKILSKGEYELGKSIKKFIDEFKKKYQSLKIEEINNLETKKIMMEVAKILELCTNTLNSTYNNNPDYDLVYFSIASEQFIFNKIYYIIYDIYDKKYQIQNNTFLSVQKEINQNLNINEIFQIIGVKKKFRGPEKIPFKSVIDIVNMVPLEKSLRKKYEILTQGSLEIRTYILEYTNGKCELDSMDDELPIIIYIATQVKVENLFAELNIINEYIKSILRDNLIQNKMVTNLLSSLIYISNNWNRETLSFDDN